MSKKKRKHGSSDHPNDRPRISVNRFYIIADAIVRIARTIIRAALFAWLGWCSYLSIRELAGSETIVNVGLGLLAKMDVSKSVVSIVALICGGWAVGERKLRQSKVKRLSARITVLEMQIDPQRSSSRLLSDGTPRPEDL